MTIKALNSPGFEKYYTKYVLLIMDVPHAIISDP